MRLFVLTLILFFLAISQAQEDGDANEFNWEDLDPGLLETLQARLGQEADGDLEVEQDRLGQEADGDLEVDDSEDDDEEEEEKVMAKPSIPENYHFSEDDLKAVTSNADAFDFGAQVNRVMDLIVNSLYSNKDIFLRELISNASDALDKIRMKSLQDHDELNSRENLDIRISMDKENRLLFIEDGGIGMTREELVSNLGTIAKSGTSEMKQLVEGGGDASNLIGQFGVGFYSAFLVADKVTVTTKSNDSPDQLIWESNADGYSISKDPRGNTLGRGTLITLHMKETLDEDYLERRVLSNLISKYSQFISYPIFLFDDSPVEEEKLEEHDPWEEVSAEEPIWAKHASQVTDEEYKDFYKQSCHAHMKEPLDWIHFSAEGDYNFRALLYFKPIELADIQSVTENPLEMKLYVRRVLITDQFADFVPRWLSFLCGVIESDDIPLNVNRESLQESKILHAMVNHITTKVVRRLEELQADYEQTFHEDDEEESADDVEKQDEEEKDDEDDAYVSKEERSKQDEDVRKHWTNIYERYEPLLKVASVMLGQQRFGKPFRTGKRLFNLLQFYSSTATHEVGTSVNGLYKDTRAVDYIARAQNRDADDPVGKKILFIPSTPQTVDHNPIYRTAIKRGYEVLVCDDPVYVESLFQMYPQDGYTFQNILGSNFDLFDQTSEEEFEALKEKFAPLIDAFSRINRKGSFTISRKELDGPAVITYNEMFGSPQLRRVKQEFMATRGDMQPDFRTMELNPYHPIMTNMLDAIVEDPNDEHVLETAAVLYDLSSLVAGYEPDDVNKLITTILRLVGRGYDLDPSLVADSLEAFKPYVAPTPEPVAEEDDFDFDEDEVTLDDVETDTDEKEEL